MLTFHPPIRPLSHTSLLRYLLKSCFICLLCLVWGDLRGKIANPNFEHELATRGKASWILSLFLMIMVQSVRPEWWKCQPAYLSGTAWRWGVWPVRKTRTCFEKTRAKLLFLLASYTGAWCLCLHVGWGTSDKNAYYYDACVCICTCLNAHRGEQEFKQQLFVYVEERTVFFWAYPLWLMLLTASGQVGFLLQNTVIHEVGVSEMDNCWPEDNLFHSGKLSQHMHASYVKH